MSRIWKDIEGFEGRYQVSDDGYVRSLPDISPGGKFLPGKILSLNGKVTGYPKVSLGTGNQRLVHRLVALAFLPNPLNYPQINHKDGDRGNPRAKNLEWCNNSQNQIHRHRVLGQQCHLTGRVGINCMNSKPVEARNVCTGELTYYGAAVEAARLLSISDSGISNSARGKVRAHKGYTWRYITREEYAKAVSA